MDWQSYLVKLSRHLLANLDDDELEELRETASTNDYLGFPPASIELIEQAQHRLGFELPSSLASFYLASNGWQSADGFPVGKANILSVTELILLSDCHIRELDIYSIFVEQHFAGLSYGERNSKLENCVVIVDLDGNELGFMVRTDRKDDWPVVTHNPDGDDFETYSGFVELMKAGITF
jgi:hypothetical protein